MPPAVWPDGFAPELRSDPVEARRLLDEAGYADRADLGTITVSGSGLDVGPAVAAWREELGVEVGVETMSFGDYLVQLDERRAPAIFTVTWIADYPSPHAIYGLLLAGDAASNYGEWNDPELDGLLEAAARAPVDDAGAAYSDVEERLAEEAPVIPWSYGETWWLVAEGLRGLGSLTIGLVDFGRVSWDG